MVLAPNPTQLAWFAGALLAACLATSTAHGAGCQTTPQPHLAGFEALTPYLDFEFASLVSAQGASHWTPRPCSGDLPSNPRPISFAPNSLIVDTTADQPTQPDQAFWVTQDTLSPVDGSRPHERPPRA